MNTLSYILGSEEKIIINGEYYFGQLWDGNNNGEELLESGAISPDGENGESRSFFICSLNVKIEINHKRRR